ncbi:MAG: sigma-54-dependent Fis family transcriptional regulator [Acidobacteria bacterium]|nr:sigma-54-dependent Fis family transcriptional regulator [Acidobacteriota bacterium]
MNTILVVDDERSMRDLLSIMLKKQGYTVFTAESGEQAKRLMVEESVDLLISDIIMPGGDGIDLLKFTKEFSPATAVIMITAFASPRSAVDTLKLGAIDYITKPFDIDEIRMVVRQAFDKKKLIGRAIICKSPKMDQILRLVEQVARTNSTILIMGESGTGKELVALHTHACSLRKDNRFFSINCGALPETLLESELFGHMKGSFTGAFNNKKGLLEVADHGTLLLDEIADMSTPMQVKLLRFLQERTIRRIGGVKDIPVDVRIIAATNKDLPKLAAEGKFREDLFYRINVIPIQIPPLRDRREDILPIAEHFLQRFCRQIDKPITGFAPEAVEMLMEWTWPGNVRELENAVERAVALELGDRVSVGSLPERILGGQRAGASAQSANAAELGQGFNLEEYVQEIERTFIARALEQSRGAQKRAAELLGITPRSLRYYMSKYGLRRLASDE